MDRVWAGTGRVTSRMPVSFGIFGNVALTLTELRQPLRKGWHVLTGDGRADAGRMVSLPADLSNMTPPTLLSASRTSPSKASDTLTWIFEGLSSMAAPQRAPSATAAGQLSPDEV